MALSLAAVALLRKQAPLPSLEGLALETFCWRRWLRWRWPGFIGGGTGAFGQHGLAADIADGRGRGHRRALAAVRQRRGAS